jgi:para-nitrobenzyl esterase
VEKLFAEWKLAKKEVKGGMRSCSPVLDGKLIVGTGVDLLSAGKQKKIPYMAGSTSEDMMPPILYSMAKNWCQVQTTPAYGWYFDRQLPGDKNGAWHSSDLWYWFGTLENCWRPMTEKDQALSDRMTDYLCSFVKTGDPNCQGQPVALSSEDGVFRAPEYTITSAPDKGQAPYEIAYVKELPDVDVAS